MSLSARDFSLHLIKILDNSLIKDNPQVFLENLSHSSGSFSVRSVVAKLWNQPELRPFLLRALKNHHFFSDYLFLSRAHLASGPKAEVLANLNLSLIAEDHLHQGQARDFIHFIADFPSLMAEIPVPMARLLASVGRSSDALNLLMRVPEQEDPDVLYTTGWLEFHKGDKGKASKYRDKLEELYAQNIASFLRTRSVAESHALLVSNTPIAQVFPFIGIANQHRISCKNPRVAAEAAMHVYQTLHLTHPGNTKFDNINFMHEENIQTASTSSINSIMERGINAYCLKLHSIPSEIIEIYSETIDDSISLAKKLPRRADESFYHGTWGQSESQNSLKIEDMLRGIDLHGGLRAINPTSLRPSLTRETHYIDGMLAYYFADSSPFWIYSWGWAFGRFGFWLPEQNASINTRPMLRGNAVDASRKISHYTAQYNEEIKQRRKAKARTAIICGLNPNIGHHYHNELSGLYRAKRNNLFQSPFAYISYNHDYYNANDLLQTAEDRLFIVRTHTDLTSLILNEALFVVWPTDISAFDGLGDLITTQSLQKTYDSDFYTVQDALNKSELRILFNLRTKQRIWIHQKFAISTILQCIVEIANRLDISKIAFIIDGATSTSSPDRAEIELIEREKLEFQELMELPGMLRFQNFVFSVIGFGFYEKAALFSKLDFAICPKGNGHLPTVAWISRVPTLLHSNSMDIRDAGTENSFCETPATPTVLGRPAMSDTLEQLSGSLRWSGGGWGELMQENYTIDMQYMTAVLTSKLNSIILAKKHGEPE